MSLNDFINEFNLFRIIFKQKLNSMHKMIATDQQSIQINDKHHSYTVVDQ